MKVNNLKTFVLFLVLTYFSLLPTLLFSQVDTAWVRRYNGPGNGSDRAYGMSVDNNGNVYVTGRSYDSVSGYDITTIKYDANGNEIWVRRYNGPENGNDWGNAIVLDNFGNLYVTGISWSSETDFDYITIKYDTNGNEIWVRRYNGPGDSTDAAFAIAVDNSGNVYVTGYSYGLDSEKDFLTIKYDADGNQIWVKRYNGPGNREDQAEAIAVDNQGNVYVTGYSFGLNTSYDYATIKYDSNGNELWVKRYDGPQNYEDVATDLAIDNNGNIYVTGYSYYDSTTGDDYTTIKYDSNGNEIWIRRYSYFSNYGDYAYAIAVDNFGNVFVTGECWGSIMDCDCITVKYDANGNQLWAARYNAAYYADVGLKIATDNFGNVYVGGISFVSWTNCNYSTMKYNANGRREWLKGYEGPGNSTDELTAIAVDNRGNVYVTGYSYGLGTSYDYATIKYIQEPSISEEKENKITKKIITKGSEIYDITGKLVKNKKLKKGIYFLKTEKENRKIVILR